ncbi:interferon-stimulated 20 kDa exonuclease-like 2 [Ictalurus furcatus]|uniref:interferon-stimulated 20 kDa exonuclease-like 2 n=1 Tax=Ictalurus furcatus TaxID=66913 RepID=UPI0023507FAF|nr:interferon-stimulated 20 kDa exonuclease-like 2 [Ictalurus furcatus]
MSGINLNLDFSGPGRNECQEKASGNAKHEQFNRKRRYLERKGLLNKKQNTNNSQKGKCTKNHLHWKRRDHSQASAVFPKFTTLQPELSANSPNFMQAHHGNSATIKEFTVPSKSTSRVGFSSVLHNPMKYVALDCEMVGTGLKGHCSELARCSIVSYDGDVIYDKFIKPVNPVTDLRTPWSGVRWRDLHNATPFKQAQREIVNILTGKVVVGHAVHNDFKVLHYFHPVHLVRDTSRSPILNRKADLPENKSASLKTLTKILLNMDIQMGKRGHSSVEDAKATMELYKKVAVEWETTLALNTAS